METSLLNILGLISFALVFFIGNLLCQVISVRKTIVNIDYFQSISAAFAGIILGFGYILMDEIEPLGEIAFFAGIVLAGISILSMISGLKHLVISGDSIRIGNSFFILTGLFHTDKNESSFHNLLQLFSRFSWEFPQTFVGYLFTQTMNSIGRVEEVRFIAGATFCLHYLKSNRRQGVSIGNFIHVSFIQRAIRFENDPLLLHEYGHQLQSRRWGLLYLFAVGIPSLISAIRAKPLPGGITTHDLKWYEMQANRYAATYLYRNFQTDWIQFEPPRNSFPRKRYKDIT